MSLLNRPRVTLGVICSLTFSGLACGQTLFDEFVKSTLRLALDGDKSPMISSESPNPENTNLAIDLLQGTLGFECRKAESNSYPGISFTIKERNQTLKVFTRSNDLISLVEAEISLVSEGEMVPIGGYKFSLNSGRFSVKSGDLNTAGNDWSLLYDRIPLLISPPVQPIYQNESWVDIEGAPVDVELAGQLVGSGLGCTSFIDSMMGYEARFSELEELFKKEDIKCNGSKGEQFNDCLFKVLQKCDSDPQYRALTEGVRRELREAVRDGKNSEVMSILNKYQIGRNFTRDLESFCEAYGAAAFPGVLTPESFLNAVKYEASSDSKSPDRDYCFERPAKLLRDMHINLDKFKSVAGQNKEARSNFQRLTSEYEDFIQWREGLFQRIVDFSNIATQCCRDKSCRELYQTEISIKN